MVVQNRKRLPVATIFHLVLLLFVDTLLHLLDTRAQLAQFEPVFLFVRGNLLKVRNDIVLGAITILVARDGGLGVLVQPLKDLLQKVRFFVDKAEFVIV